MTFTKNTGPDTSSEAECNAAFVADFTNQVRERRDKLLSETDYIHLPDVTVSDSFKAAMNTYRQELRDIPSKVEETLKDKNIFYVAIEALPWPIKPS